MNSVTVVTSALSVLSLAFAANALAQSDLPPAALANSVDCRPDATSCPGFGDIGGECCPWSDESLKTEVMPLKSATENLLKIQGVTFEWKDGGRKDIGVIAQDVAKVYPELTRTQDGLMQVDYDKLVAPLIESIRELNQRIDALETATAR